MRRDRAEWRGRARRTSGARLAAAALLAALALPAPARAKPPGGDEVPSLAGRLLVAAPDMRDPRFSRAVVYVVHHGAGGALGLVLNRASEEILVADLLARLGEAHEGVRGSMRMHYGGPVEPGRVFVLHTDDYRGEGTHVVANGIALTTAPGILRAIGTGAGPRRSRLFLSYSGWAPGQLERELRTGRWVSVPADVALVFDGDPGTRWERALRRQGRLDL